MRTHSRCIVSAAAAVAIVLAFGLAVTHAQGVPGVDVNKCLAGKTKCVNKKVAKLLKCREKCQENPAKCGSVQTGCETKVRAKFDGGTKGVAYSCFGKLEAKDDGVTPEKICTTTGDLVAMETKADAFVADVVAALEGSPLPGCGNGVVEGVESCDGADLGGESCTSLGFASGALTCTLGCGYEVSGCACAPSQAFPATGQTTCWDSSGTVIPCAGTGHDGDVRAGAPLAYQDNGDGTITDLNTGLMWEKKSDDGSINDVNTLYTWDNAFAVHVAGLNSASFAGHTDWRVPNYKELISILNLENFSPAVSPAFNNNCTPGCTVLTCSCTASIYWSSTSLPAGLLPYAWVVDLGSGFVGSGDKGSGGVFVRAVRGGS